jgi:hypothetical protein
VSNIQANPPLQSLGAIALIVTILRDRPLGFSYIQRGRRSPLFYNRESLTIRITAMKHLIQQELEKLDQEQLKQVFEFIAFLKFRARLVTIPAIDETNLAALYSEFGEEDQQLAELGISEYAELLKHEDLV